jgi:hypothetical protein
MSFLFDLCTAAPISPCPLLSPYPRFRASFNRHSDRIPLRRLGFKSGTVTASPPHADCLLVLVRRSLAPADRVPFLRRGLGGAWRLVSVSSACISSPPCGNTLFLSSSLFPDASSNSFRSKSIVLVHTLLFSYPIIPIPSPILSSPCTSPQNHC